MKSETGYWKYLAFGLLTPVLAAAGIGMPAKAGHQAQAEPSSKPIITTSVNEKTPASGITIASGTIVETTNVPRLLVNLGKLGRVELSKNSRIKLSYSENLITGSLDAGRVRISSPAGVSANISTRDGDVVADDSAATAYTIDTSCGNTIVTVKNGQVELRSGGEVKKIPAGAQGSVGTPRKRCN